MRSALYFFFCLSLSVLPPMESMADPQMRWPDTPLARLAARAVLQELNVDLLSHDSATLTLDRWCARHLQGEGHKIIAERIKGQDKPADIDVRAALKVSMEEPVGYRHVQLKCGDKVLSNADNWYVPARLTADMNHSLETTDTPFGRVVQALDFRRHTFSADLLWKPLVDGWEMASPPVATNAAYLIIPEDVLRHRALLSLPNGEPISLVQETYTSAIMDFAPPRILEKP